MLSQNRYGKDKKLLWQERQKFLAAYLSVDGTETRDW